jgi:cytidine deaminase
MRFRRNVLSKADGAEALIEVAVAVRKNAHAPYSGFRVGAALRAASGAVYRGCNVENAAYPEGLCAEACAIAAMVAGGETAIAEMAVVADRPDPVPPCGGCRQKLAEFSAPEVQVMLATLGGARRVTTMGELLPGAFGAGNLGPGRK